jgi:hypothetical protein
VIKYQYTTLSRKKQGVFPAGGVGRERVRRGEKNVRAFSKKYKKALDKLAGGNYNSIDIS